MLQWKRIYNWEGISPEGNPIKGRAQAPSLALAKHELSKQNVFIKKIHLAGFATCCLKYQSKQRIKACHLTLLTRQLATLINAGIPLLQSFEIMIKNQSHVALRWVLEDIQKQLATGLTLAESLKKHPQIFDSLYCHLIEAGEHSGKLDSLLIIIATLKEKNAHIIQKVKKALFYPVLVLVMSLLITSLLLLCVIPQFQDVFHNLGATLPALTLFVIALSTQFQHHGAMLLGLLLLSMGLTHYAYHTASSFKYWIDKLRLKLPLMGTLIQKASIARFTRTLAITFSAGLPLFDALKLVANSAGNSVYIKALQRTQDEVASGQLMHIALSHSPLFPDLVIQLLAIGEESGALEDMLLNIATQYEQDVETTIDNLTTLIEPFMVCVLGILVGGVVLAMYLPIFQIGAII
ncbi:MAG: type II secretion system F family protein [Gammaproteobacteria bacterium]|nr:type II secretion system F family protein [Gammaproteobacteria bacterium]